MGTDKKSFIMYTENADVFDALPDEECAALIRAIFHYEQDGTEPNLTGSALIAFLMIQKSLDWNRQAYERVKKARREAGRKSGEARRNKAEQNTVSSKPVEQNEQTSVLLEQNEQTETNRTDTVTVTVTDTVTDNTLDILPPRKRRAKKTPCDIPTLQEVQEYARTRPGVSNPDYEAERFYDFYSSNGWKVSGRAPMCDWKASVRNWFRNDRKYSTKQPSKTRFHNFEERQDDLDELQMLSAQRILNAQ